MGEFLGNVPLLLDLHIESLFPVFAEYCEASEFMLSKFICETFVNRLSVGPFDFHLRRQQFSYRQMCLTGEGGESQKQV